MINEAGTVVESYDYYPLGLQMPGRSYNSGVAEDIYKFSSKELDQELGLDWYYFGARYYDPAIARWLAVDPKAHWYPSLSPYNYAANNPLYYKDPNGEYLESIVDIGFILYDVGEIAYDYATTGEVDPISVAALTADVACLATPVATGGGLAVRAAKAGAKKVLKNTVKKETKNTVKKETRKQVFKEYSTRKKTLDARPRPKPAKKGKKQVTRQKKNKNGTGKKSEKHDPKHKNRHYHDDQHNNKKKPNVHYIDKSSK